MLKISLIGFGAIGKALFKAIVEGKAGNIQLVAILIRRGGKRAEKIATNLGLKEVTVTSDPAVLLENPEIELILEAASQKAVKALGERVLKSGKELIIMSVGALVDSDLLNTLKKAAEATGKKIYLPSGAICGLDGVKSASIAELSEVTLITRKNPKGLEGAPYIVKNDIKLSEITKPTVLFEGPAKEAAEGFPKNVNVAAALSIAGIGPIRTKVKIIADPTIHRNIHEIVAKGEFGELRTLTENVVCPDNPKTSYLAALAAIRTLKKLTEPIQIGT